MVIYYRYVFSREHLFLEEYEVIKYTEKGVWVDVYGNYNRAEDKKEYLKKYCKFVLSKAKKRFAYPTKELALNSLKRRTERRVMFLARDLRYAEIHLQKLNINFEKILLEDIKCLWVGEDDSLKLTL